MAVSTSIVKERPLADVFRIISFIPFEKYSLHKHKRLEMNYVKKGDCFVYTEERNIYFKENEMMIICSDVKHSFEAGSRGCTLMQLEFQPDNLLAVVSQNESYKKIAEEVFFSNNGVIRISNNLRIMRVVRRVIIELNDKKSFYKDLVEMYYFELLILIHRYLKENYLPLCNHPILKNLFRYIEHHYKDSISMNDLQEVAKLSDRSVRNLFAKYVECSPFEYITKVRLERSIELLWLTNWSVKQICFECGFSTPQYFARVFKQHMHCTPTEFVQKRIDSNKK